MSSFVYNTGFSDSDFEITNGQISYYTSIDDTIPANTFIKIYNEFQKTLVRSTQFSYGSGGNPSSFCKLNDTLYVGAKITAGKASSSSSMIYLYDTSSSTYASFNASSKTINDTSVCRLDDDLLIFVCYSTFGILKVEQSDGQTPTITRIGTFEGSTYSMNLYCQILGSYKVTDDVYFIQAYANNSTTSYLHSFLITVNNDTLTVTKHVQHSSILIPSSSYSLSRIEYNIVQLSNGNLLCTCYTVKDTTYNNKVFAAIFSVSDSSISLLNNIQWTDTSTYGDTILPISDDRFILFGSSYFSIYQVSNSTFTRLVYESVDIDLSNYHRGIFAPINDTCFIGFSTTGTTDYITINICMFNLNNVVETYSFKDNSNYYIESASYDDRYLLEIFPYNEKSVRLSGWFYDSTNDKTYYRLYNISYENGISTTYSTIDGITIDEIDSENSGRVYILGG